MDGAGLDLHHEQDIQPLQQHGVHVQEIARQDAGRLGLQELPPRRRRPPRRWAEPGGGQDPPDRPLPLQPRAPMTGAAMAPVIGVSWACVGDLFGVGDYGDLTDEGVFRGGVEEEVGDVCARG
jgi:hypothetical protein